MPGRVGAALGLDRFQLGRIGHPVEPQCHRLHAAAAVEHLGGALVDFLRESIRLRHQKRVRFIDRHEQRRS